MVKAVEHPRLPAWPPTVFRRIERVLPTSTSPAIIVTDAGRVYAKALGNPEGPHALACELIGMNLARLLGLQTPDFGILQLAESDVFRLHNGSECEPGPAFVSRAIQSRAWDGSAKDLEAIINVDDVSRLVVLDTWLLNPDRMPRVPVATEPPHPAARNGRPNWDNVLLAMPELIPADRVLLMAIDFTHCLTAGRELTKSVASLDRIRDEGIYGLFEHFRPFIRQDVLHTTAERLRAVSEPEIEAILAQLPKEWSVSQGVLSAVRRFLLQRAHWLSDRIVPLVQDWQCKHPSLPLWEKGESH